MVPPTHIYHSSIRCLLPFSKNKVSFKAGCSAILVVGRLHLSAVIAGWASISHISPHAKLLTRQLECTTFNFPTISALFPVRNSREVKKRTQELQLRSSLTLFPVSYTNTIKRLGVQILLLHTAHRRILAIIRLL